MEQKASRIVDHILVDTREDANSIVAEARKSAEVMIEEQRELGRQKASERVSSILEKAKSEVDIIRGTVFSNTRKKANWMMLSEKERLITGVMDEAKKRLVSQAKTKAYLSQLEKLIVDAAVVLGGGKLELTLNERDSSLPLELDRLSRQVQERTGTKTAFQLSKEKSIASGGAIVRTADRRVLVDNTFEEILKRREKDLTLKIAKILFK